MIKKLELIKKHGPQRTFQPFYHRKISFPAIRGLNLFSLSFGEKSFSTPAHFELSSILTLTAFLFLGTHAEYIIPSFIKNVNIL